MKLTVYLYLVPRSRMMELYLHSPSCLQDIVFKQLSTGTTDVQTCLYLKTVVFCDMNLKMEAAGFFKTLHLSTRLCGVTKGWSRNNALGLHFGGACFESQLGHWLSWLKAFMGLLIPSRQMPRKYPSGHDCFLPHPSQFISHPTNQHYTLTAL
jgi:hypothetical protein